MVSSTLRDVASRADIKPISERITAAPVVADSAGPVLSTGIVRSFLFETVASIELTDGTGHHATQATSCLLAPAIGDRVLLCREKDDVFILAILAREHAFNAEIGVPNADRISIRAAKEVTLEAPLLRLAAGRVAVLCEQLVQVGTSLTSNFRRMVESVGDKSIKAQVISTQVENRATVVTGTDMLRAQSLVESVEGVATQTSEIALVTARRDVRLDGERVSLG